MFELNENLEVKEDFLLGSKIFTIDNLPINEVDMLTILIVGNSQSVFQDDYFVTPRGYSSI